ncbi:Flagellar basal-body rod protein FlgC [Buchnera aphidicola (Thelaxes suberi)]|uniref:flagellar basal body rod protein FlgC n=1 Tax=Buchnera aphidicola TaxID=9 RepID=UPI003463D160
MSLFNVMNIASSALKTQSNIMKITAENLANVNTIIQQHGRKIPYRSKKIIIKFNPSYEAKIIQNNYKNIGGIKSHIVENPLSKKLVYNPHHPLSDAKGYVLSSDVDIIAENINAMEAARNYESNIEMLNTVKTMILKTLTIGQ